MRGGANILAIELSLNQSHHRTKASHADSEADRETLTSRWQTAHDMCSLVTCNTAFEDCKEGETYDLGKCSNNT